jgi:hypothetical protein
MLKKLTSIATSNDPLMNWAKTIIILLALIPVVIFMSNATTSQDWLWFKTGFDERPNRIIIYHDGGQVELRAGQPGFDGLAEAIRASLAGGVEQQSSVGLSEVSRREAYTRYTTVEAFFDGPVKLHAFFYTGHPTQMLFPITGRHSDWPIVFLGDDGEYQANAPVLKTIAPIREQLRVMEIIE